MLWTYCNLTIHFTQLLLSPCFGSHFLSSLSSFSHFLGCETHPSENDNSKDVCLSLKTLKWRVARLVDVGLQVFLYFHEACTVYLCFKLSKLSLNAIQCIFFGQYLACFRVQCILNDRYTDIH